MQSETRPLGTGAFLGRTEIKVQARDIAPTLRPKFRGTPRRDISKMMNPCCTALRSLLYKHGHVFPVGLGALGRMQALVADERSDPPGLLREGCQDLLTQIAEKSARIAARDQKLKDLAARS